MKGSVRNRVRSLLAKRTPSLLKKTKLESNQPGPREQYYPESKL